MIERITDNNLNWIAPEARRVDANFPIETAYFKLVFNLTDAADATAGITISANSRYCLYINGQAVLDGPCKGTEWYQFGEELDIASYLRTGSNVLAVKVVAFHSQHNADSARNNMGLCSVMANSTGPMLLLGGSVACADGKSVPLATGEADWFCKTDDAVTWRLDGMVGLFGCTEDTDGSKLPHGWADCTDDGDGFSKPVTRFGSAIDYGEFTRVMLYKRPIPFLIREKLPALSILPGTGNLLFDANGKAVCAPNTTYTIVLEAPKLTTSFVELATEGGAGSVIRLSYSEGYIQKNSGRDAEHMVLKKHRKDITGDFNGISDFYRPGGGMEVYKPFWFRTFMLLQIEVTTGDAPLTLHTPVLTETRYPLACKAEIASEAQDWVHPVWDMSLRTLQLCMHETYEDCPFYEQLQYIMDTRLQILFTYSIGNDPRMARRTIHDFHTSTLPEGITQSRYPSNSRQVIPAFSLHWILMLHDYYEETGDLAFVAPYRATAERIFEWFERHKNGDGLLADLGYWDFADWADAWKSGVPNAVTKGGVGTINNLCYVYTLQTVAPLFEVLGFGNLAAKYKAEARDVSERVMALCWDDERQLLREGPGFNEYSQHAQMWAVLCGLFTGSEARLLMSRVLADTTLVPCSFVMQFYMFRALEAAGLYDKTEKLWEMWRSLLDDGLSTVPEIPGPQTRSDCHAWGALMLYEFPRKALGVRPLKPGYSEIEVKPLAVYMKDARGSVPTPHGAVDVDWTTDGGRFTLHVVTPVPARISLPDGTVVQAAPGEHTVTAHLG